MFRDLLVHPAMEVELLAMLMLEVLVAMEVLQETKEAMEVPLVTTVSSKIWEVLLQDPVQRQKRKQPQIPRLQEETRKPALMQSLMQVPALEASAQITFPVPLTPTEILSEVLEVQEARVVQWP